MKEHNTGDKQEDDQDNTNYERMEQCEEFELDPAIHQTATDDALTNTTVQLTQKSTMEQLCTTIKQQAAITKHEKIKMLTQEYQALAATLHCQHPGDDSDAVRRTIEQVERQYNTLVSRFQRKNADTGLHPPPLHV